MTLSFHVVVDDSLLGLGLGTDPATDGKKCLLSILNDFEDGAWRTDNFETFVWDNIAETALSKRERDALGQSPASMLKESAKNLRLTDSTKDPGKGSELAEIVMYGLLKHKYGALPVVPKIFYKQNVNDNAKGADSVHITREGEDDFALWFGETKFYNDISDVRLAPIVDSVEESLDSGKLKKENAIIRSLGDLDLLDLPQTLRDSIRKALSNKESIDPLKPKIRVPILLLHECPITAGTQEFSAGYRNDVIAFHTERARSYFQKQTARLVDTVFQYRAITFYLILFPVPKKSPIVEAFLGTAKFHRGRANRGCVR